MSTLYEQQTDHSNELMDVYGTRYCLQTITPTVKHSLATWRVWSHKHGTPGTFYVDLYLANASHLPTGGVFASGSMSTSAWTAVATGAEYEVTLSPAYPLQIGVEYCLVMHISGSSYGNHITIQGKSSGNPYANGVFAITTSYPTGWSVQSLWDAYFKAYGDPVIDPPTVATNAATDIDYDRATLHGTLTSDGGEACQVRFHYGLTTDYGMTTEYQAGKVTGNTFQQEITDLQDEKTYHFKAEAKNSAGTTYGADAEFNTTQAPLPEGKQVKALITHPAIKRVKVIFYDQEIADYDQLSNPEEQRIESSLEIPVPTPCTIEVTTLADQVFEFKIPLKS